MNQAACPRGRPGVAAIWMLAVLAILSAVLMATTWQHLAARRTLDQRYKELQADWLARAGAELAADCMLNDPADYAGETLAPLPGSQVRITVRSQPFLALLGVHIAASLGSPSSQGPLLAAVGRIPQIARPADVFLVTSEARYRTDEPAVVVRSATRLWRRVVEKDRVYLEASGAQHSP